jgi:hypothetical protein
VKGITHMRILTKILPLLAIMALTACEGAGAFQGLQQYPGPNAAIAIAQDRGRDANVLQDGQAAIVYDPDGCQGWLIDDGLEGYSGRRFDPVSGLPICNNLYPPGTVLGKYTTTGQGIRDYVPGVVVGR